MLSAKHFVYVDSRNRLAGTDSNFTYNINFPPDAQFDRVVVLNALIPKSYYLVQTGHNTFTLTEGTSAVTVTVPVGCYLLDTFRSVVQGVLNTASPHGWVYAVSYPTITTSANTGKYTFTVTGNTSQPSITVTSTFFEPLGFASGSTNAFVGSTLTSTNVIKLQTEDRLFLNSNLVDGDEGNASVLQTVNSAPSPDFSTITYSCYAPEYYAKKISSKHSNTSSFTLTNEAGTIMDLNGLNMTMTLMFYKENDILIKLKSFIQLMALKDKAQQQ